MISSMQLFEKFAAHPELIACKRTHLCVSSIPLVFILKRICVWHKVFAFTMPQITLAVLFFTSAVIFIFCIGVTVCKVTADSGLGTLKQHLPYI